MNSRCMPGRGKIRRNLNIWIEYSGSKQMTIVDILQTINIEEKRTKIIWNTITTISDDFCSGGWAGDLIGNRYTTGK